MDTKKKKKKISPYMVFSTIVIILLAIAFAFPLYWILTGSFKTQISINSTTPEWWPSEWVMTNYDKLFSRQKSPLWEFAVPFSSRFSADGKDIIWWAGPQVPAAVRWLINTVFMAVASMILTCITSAMAGYALAKKRFVGRSQCPAGLHNQPVQPCRYRRRLPPECGSFRCGPGFFWPEPAVWASAGAHSP